PARRLSGCELNLCSVSQVDQIFFRSVLRVWLQVCTKMTAAVTGRVSSTGNRSPCTPPCPHTARTSPKLNPPAPLCRTAPYLPRENGYNGCIYATGYRFHV